MDFGSYIDLDTLLFRAVAFLLAVTLHGCWMALFSRWLGDRTAGEQGRLSLNPGKHLDPLGTVMVLFGPYGWNRSVPVHPDHFGKSAKGKLALWALSGPLLHLVLALLFGWLFLELPVAAGGGSWAGALFKGILHYCYIVNVMLFLLNLLPIYPLNGWKLLRHLAGERAAAYLDKYEKWGLLVLIALLALPAGQRLLEMLFQLVNQWLMKGYSV